jgi:plasmid stability protein
VAQIVVRNLEESVKLQIQRRAKRHGRSMEDEVRHILRDVAGEKPVQRKLGTELAELFRGIGFKPGEIRELRGSVRPARFD